MLYIIRHGETEWNLKCLPQGKKDSPLTEKGVQQAKGIAKLLNNINKEIHNYKFIVSTSGRARQTAEIIKKELDIKDDFIYEPLLEELSFGLFEGLSKDIIREKFPEEVKLKRQNRWDFIYPEGESRAILAQRLALFMEKYKHIKNKVLITHNGVSAVLRGMLEDEKHHNITSNEYSHNQNEVYSWDGKKMKKFVVD